MIKLFRKTRQKELTKNNIRKYLLYALGEILLVVVGILIALQINNWNEERKKGATEEKIAISIYDELQQNKQYTKGHFEFISKRLVHLETLLEFTSSDAPAIKESEFFEKIVVGLSSVGYKPIISKLNKVLSLESLNFRKSPNLMQKLTNYQFEIRGLNSLNQGIKDNWKLSMLPLLIEEFPIRNLVNAIVNNNVTRSKHEPNIEKLMDNLLFENNLANTYMDIKSLEFLLNSVLKEIDEVSNSIKVDYPIIEEVRD